MAGLLGYSAWVSVGPPLFCRPASCGSTPLMSPGPVRLHELSELRLWPRDVIVLTQFDPWPVFAISVFLIAERPDIAAVSKSVTFSRITGLSDVFRIDPFPTTDTFCEIVLLETLT